MFSGSPVFSAVIVLCQQPCVCGFSGPFGDSLSFRQLYRMANCIMCRPVNDERGQDNRQDRMEICPYMSRENRQWLWLSATWSVRKGAREHYPVLARIRATHYPESALYFRFGPVHISPGPVSICRDLTFGPAGTLSKPCISTVSQSATYLRLSIQTTLTYLSSPPGNNAFI